MDELPLQNKLVQRNPEVYKKDWKCMLCNQEQESWSHLWQCSHLLPRLTALQQATKKDLRIFYLPLYLTDQQSSHPHGTLYHVGHYQQSIILTILHLTTSF